MPERLIANAPEVIVDHMLDSLAEVPGAFPEGVRAEYLAKLSAPATIHAICEQYRAAATLDYLHDAADRGRRRIGCPVLVLWSHRGAVASWYEPLEVWRAWCDQVHGGPIAAGHFLPRKHPTRRPVTSSNSSHNRNTIARHGDRRPATWAISTASSVAVAGRR